MSSVPEQDKRNLPDPVLPDTRARLIPRDQHGISRNRISDNALKVLYRLINAGYQAFLVGGGVRDLLLELDPKDFDIATDATPEQVRDLFRNARLIGRRFRLVHVRFGPEIIEVATFRGHGSDAPLDADDVVLPSRRAARPDEPAAVQSGSGMLLRDNVYGDIEDDAARRDFTINALYYTPADFCVYDFADGLRDLEHRQIRLIGDPVQRYREDPVRMLRAIRFAAKLGFDIAPESAAPIIEQADLLCDVPPARLFDEVVKLFLAGKAEATYDLMQTHGIFAMLFPEAAPLLQDPTAERLLRTAMANTDRRIANDQPVTPGFLYAAILWPGVCQRQQELTDEGHAPMQAWALATEEVLARQQAHTAVPRRFANFVRETWALQPRLESPRAKQVDRIMDLPRFRAAYDFLLVREQAGEETCNMADWWTRIQEADDDTRQAMIQALGTGGGGGKRRKRRRKRRPE